MNEGVYYADESPVAARIILSRTPRYHWHDRMVIQMQKCDLSVLLSYYEEYRVKEFRHFRKEVYVYPSRDLKVRKQSELETFRFFKR